MVPVSVTSAVSVAAPVYVCVLPVLWMFAPKLDVPPTVTPPASTVSWPPPTTRLPAMFTVPIVVAFSVVRFSVLTSPSTLTLLIPSRVSVKPPLTPLAISIVPAASSTSPVITTPLLSSRSIVVAVTLPPKLASPVTWKVVTALTVLPKVPLPVTVRSWLFPVSVLPNVTVVPVRFNAPTLSTVAAPV